MTIYLDHAATTPVDPRVAAVMAESLQSPAQQANAASATHRAGRDVAALVEAARADVAALIGAAPREIVFTSGATESNNLAILGVWNLARRAGARQPGAAPGHFVSARTEHRSVLDALLELERQGADVTWIEPDEWGRIPPEAVRTAVRADTLLVSIMQANNELGCINDIAAISAVCRERGVPLHTDASQAAGKIDCDVARLGADFVSFTAHKIHGPKGIGALYVRESARPKLAPIVFGGGHERGLRSGTLATHQIVGFAKAASLAAAERADDATKATALRSRLVSALAAMPGVVLNTNAGAESLPGIVNASFEGVEGESLVTGLAGLAVSTGSACSSATREPSYVLRALGRDTELAQSSLRLSVGRYTTAAEVDVAIAAIRAEVSRLRVLAGGEAISTNLPPADEPAIAGNAAATDEPPPLDALTWRYFRAPPRPLASTGKIPEGIAPLLRHGRAGRRADGAEIRVELEIHDGIVKNARFAAYGCPHTLAVTAWLCEVLEGAPIANDRWQQRLGTPADWARRFAVPTEKLGRLLIVEDAWRAALRD
ncbi:MAG TPA: aminotransferase class V-fold PLP-dependent enzyme [Steroidobacteraceae bacterium]|nr:aminotransferase class V-fold PLP-dependent enzyme [Steroidobacteraceae bacterium]